MKISYDNAARVSNNSWYLVHNHDTVHDSKIKFANVGKLHGGLPWACSELGVYRVRSCSTRTSSSSSGVAGS